MSTDCGVCLVISIRGTGASDPTLPLPGYFRVRGIHAVGATRHFVNHGTCTQYAFAYNIMLPKIYDAG